MTLVASHAPGMDRDEEAAIGREFRRGLDIARAQVADFDPEIVVLFGGDHRRAFATVAPSFAVAYTASLMPEGSIPAERLNVPTDLSRDLSAFLIDAEFDIAVCRDVELDHAFGQPLHHFLQDIARPQIVPVPVNCASPPLPMGRRVHAFGTKVGEFFDQLDKRVLFIGTGGLSHSPPSLEDDRHDKTTEERRAQIEAGFLEASQKIKPEWDEAFLGALGRWDVDELIRSTDAATAEAGVGANEVRTWLAAAAAGGGSAPQRLAYEPVPEWITGMGIAITPAA
ncbi:MAG: 3-carboxyethylcatechol 2,3-dioxygenase [Rhodoglobus sp.]|nr:3-carboxyethylcatechol 2,3-dioxygenase [Rhodoglobus sp.]